MPDFRHHGGRYWYVLVGGEEVYRSPNLQNASEEVIAQARRDVLAAAEREEAA